MQCASVIEKRVPQFFGIFDKDWDLVLRKDTPFNTSTRINIAFAKIIQTQDQHFSIAIDGSSSRQRTHRKNQISDPLCQILLSIGGDNGPTSFGGAAADKAFPLDVVKFISEIDIHGVDIDWEVGLQKNLLNQLTTGLYEAFRTNQYIQTLDGWSDCDPEYDLQLLQKTLNEINVMTYGADCDYESCANSYTSQGFPQKQMNLGIESEFNYAPGVDTLGPDGSIFNKANFAKQNGMGVFNWREDNDSADSEHPNFPRYSRGNQLWENMNSSVVKYIEKVKQFSPPKRCMSHRGLYGRPVQIYNQSAQNNRPNKSSYCSLF